MRSWAPAIAMVCMLAAPVTTQTPARDQRAQPASGAAVIAGRVVDDRGDPVPAAFVNLVGGPAPGTRTAVTTEDGRFVCAGVPPAIYTLRAAKAGYPTIEYGQKRPNGPGVPLTIAADQRLTVAVTLPRGAVIAGRVVADDGEPVAGASVVIADLAGRVLVGSAYAESDVHGRYRLWGLPAGVYRVRPSSAAPEGDDTGSPAPVTVAAGELRDAVDVRLPAPRPTTIVTVTPFTADGHRLEYPRIELRRNDAHGRAISYASRNADGSFTVAHVPAGQYVAVTQTPTESGSAPVAVDGEHPSAVMVEIRANLRIRGRASLDPAINGTPTRWYIAAASIDRDGATGGDQPSGAIDQRGEFTISVPPGRYLLRLSGGIDRGWLKSAVVNGVDAADVPIEIATQDILNVAAAIGDSPPRIDGRVATGDGAPMNAVDVVFFPADAKYRATPGSRRVAAARTSVEGAYSLSGLPPGRYAIAIVDGLVMDDLRNPAFLAGLRPVATRTIDAGDSRVDIVVATGRPPAARPPLPSAR